MRRKKLKRSPQWILNIKKNKKKKHENTKTTCAKALSPTKKQQALQNILQPFISRYITDFLFFFFFFF